MANYELWMTDDAGRRIGLIKRPFYFSYSRTTVGFGSIELGMAYQDMLDLADPYFLPDRRVEVWRSPGRGHPLRREDVWLLRKPYIYTRDDNVEVVRFYGRNGVDLLARRSVIQFAGSAAAKKTGTIDDIMKGIVREQMLYGSALDENSVVDNSLAWPQNEFLVAADTSDGPSATRSFEGRKVLDILNDLRDASFQLNLESSANRKIYFDVIPYDVSGLSTAYSSPLGWQFVTFPDLRGTDRTSGLEFSLANNNIKAPSYSISHLEEVTAVTSKGQGTGDSRLFQRVEDASRIATSRWNRVHAVLSATNEPSTAGLTAAGNAELAKGLPVEEFPVTVLDVPESRDTPRSLYGLDWDLGDLIPVTYARKQFNVELRTIHVSVDENGRETITGRNKVESG